MNTKIISLFFIFLLLLTLAIVYSFDFVPGNNYEEIVFSSDGLKLHGSLYKTEGNAKGFIVLCHGNRRSGRKHTLYKKLAEILSEDYVILTFDYRGYGDSQDPPGKQYVSLDFSSDVIAAAQYLGTRFNISQDSVILIGHSLGALQVLNAGRLLQSQTVIAIGPSDFRKNFLKTQNDRNYYMDKILGKTGMSFSTDSLESAAKPLLLENLFSDCPFNRTFLVFGEREQERTMDSRKYVNQINDFCHENRKVRIITIPYADYMYGTEPKGLSNKVLNMIPRENTEIIRLSETVKKLVEYRHYEETALPGQIIIDMENPAWLRYKDGGLFFMAGPGDPEGFLYRGTRNMDGTRNGDQIDLINKLKNTGANSIYLIAVRSHGGDASRDADDPGDPRFQNPFVDGDPSRGLDHDILDQWDIWFTEMDNNGIVIYFFFYDDGARIWDTGDTMGIEEQKFIRTIVRRLKHYKNLIWVIAEEYQEAYTAKRVSSIAAAIRAADDHNHVIAVHKHSGLDFAEFADDPYIDQFAVQYNVNTASELHRGMVSAWKKAVGRYNINMSEVAYGGMGRGAEARKKSWAIAMGGAYVMINGMDIGNTSLNELKDMGHIVNFFTSTDFNKMAPHDELGYGGTEYVLASAGDSYIAYASDLHGRIGLKSMTEGMYDFMWYDIISGERIWQEKVFVSSGNQSWEKPSGVGNEVVLYVKRMYGPA
jgi:pimeloyl-ACP methyl ester carboxylesterase